MPRAQFRCISDRPEHDPGRHKIAVVHFGRLLVSTLDIANSRNIYEYIRDIFLLIVFKLHTHQTAPTNPYITYRAKIPHQMHADINLPHPPKCCVP
jgi:hypothetical protein